MERLSAREVVASVGAADAMLLADRQEGLLNKVSFEKLVRKGYALARACRNARGKGDWSRPTDAKTWKSKVDWEAAKRLDPHVSEEGALCVMSAEEEVK